MSYEIGEVISDLNPIPVVDGQRGQKGYLLKTLTIPSTLVDLCEGFIPIGASYVRLMPEGNDIRIRSDGQMPTMDIGWPILNGQSLSYASDFSVLKLAPKAGISPKIHLWFEG